MKSYLFRACLLLLVLLVSTVGCIDHQNPQPLRYRVKSINYNDSPSIYSFNYNERGQLAFISTDVAYAAPFRYVLVQSYDSNDRIITLNNDITYYTSRESHAVKYAYNEQGQLTQINIYQYTLTFPIVVYDFFYTDNSSAPSSRRTTVVTGQHPRSTSLETYTFVDGNAIRVNDQTYSYDDKPNPYRGLWGFNTLYRLSMDYSVAIDDANFRPFKPNQSFADHSVRVFNKNNITTGAKLTYNSDGLVTQIVYADGFTESFTYEAY